MAVPFKKMNNPRITPQERGLIKGALRRVFGRSSLRDQALKCTLVRYSDPQRVRVKKWSMCAKCEKYTPTYLIEIDHIEPIIKVGSSLEEMTWDEVIDALWCELSNLQGLCPECHTSKTKAEQAVRREIKKEKKRCQIKISNKSEAKSGK